MSVFVIGHRNPDTDAICSAIGYADFLQRTTRPDAVAAACGPSNARTQFVLERAGIETPMLLASVRPTALQLCHQDPMYCRENEPFVDVYRRMTRNGYRSMPVLDDDRKVVGMLSLFNLMRQLLPDTEDMAGHRLVETNLERVRHVLTARFQNEDDIRSQDVFTILVAAMSKDKFVERLQSVDCSKVILVVGDRPSVHKAAIELGVRCLVVTGGFSISEDLLEQARASGTTVLVSTHDTAMSVMLIKGAKLIHNAIDRDFRSFHPGARVEQVVKVVHDHAQVAYPVVGDNGELIGIFSRTDLLEPLRTKLILVDHNEFRQAVDGAEEAEILEVLDHHRVGGGLITREPIRFINDTVGSTSTIVARMFRDRAIMPERGIALCLAAGIISDTLNLTSPTTTDVDHDILAWLASYAGCDLNQFAEDFFAAGSAMRSSTPEEILNGDCKEYTEGGYRFTVAQVEELGLESFWARRAELQAALDQHVSTNNLAFACLMITDITIHKSVLIASGEEEVLDAIDFPEVEDDLYELQGIVSRKKQLLPALIQGLHRLG